MKKMKRVFSVCLATALIITSVTGCGSKEPKQQPDPTGNDTESSIAPNQESESVDNSDNTSSGKEKFMIGGLGPLTGKNASYGNSVKNGAQIAVDEINAAGGVKVGDSTYELELNFADDEGTEDTAVTAYNSLMDAGIKVLLGCVTSGPCLAVADLTNQDGILQITPSASAIDCAKNDNVFRLCFTDDIQGLRMAEFAIEELGKKKIAVIYNNSDEYSTGIKDKFEEEIKKLGGEIVASEAFTADDVDFSTQLTSIKNTEAEIIFVPAYYGAIAYIAKQAKDLGIELPFIGSDGWDGILEAVTDRSVVEGAIFLSPFLATDSDPAIAKFTETYKTNYKNTPDQFAADGYDSVYVIKAAMEEAGSIENADLIAAMTKIQINGITGNVTFTADGEPNKDAKFVEIKDGEYTARK